MAGRSCIITLTRGLLVLALLIGVMAVLVVPRLFGPLPPPQIDITRGSILGLEQALELYAIQNDGLPTNAEGGIELLLGTTDGRPPYLDEYPVDGWGNPLQYTYPAVKQQDPNKADIYSFGPDGIDNGGDGGDDINNWVIEPNNR